MKVARAACLGKSNCTVAKKDVGTLDCSSKIASGTENMIIAGVCGDGKQRRATNLRYDFVLPAPVVRDPTPAKVAHHSVCGRVSLNPVLIFSKWLLSMHAECRQGERLS
eukprot:COSAG02_NODE_15003_length_1215_cov_1.401434_1_plen_108_part_10